MRKDLPEEWAELLTAAGFRSVRGVALAADLSAQAVWRLIDKTGRSSDDTVQAVAAVLSTTPGHIYSLIGVRAPAADLGPYIPPEGSERLSQKERAALDTLIRLMAKKNSPSVDEE